MCSEGMPIPVSVTDKWPPSSSTHQRISMEPSAAVYLAALSTRLEKAEWISASTPMSAASESIRRRTSRGCTGRASTSLRSSASSAGTSIGSPPTASRLLQTRELEQIVNDGRHALRLPAHFRDRPSELPVERRILTQCLEVAGDHGKRRAQLVRGVGDEVAAYRLEAHLP